MEKNNEIDAMLSKPLEEIKQDIFFRADNFKDKAWYEDFVMYTRIGTCQTSPDHALELQKALKIMGYSTHTTERGGALYISPGAVKNKGNVQRTPER